MVVLKMLLKLFPKSFQDNMGDAWLEASETEIKQRQIKQGRKQTVVLAFAWETLWNVIPEDHSNLQMTNGYKSVEDFVPQENEIVLKGFLFTINMLRFYCFGIIIGLHIAVAKFAPEVANVWKFTVPATILFIVLCNKFILKGNSYEKYVAGPMPLISCISGLVPGCITPFFFLVGIANSYEMDSSSKVFQQYQEIRNQMGLNNNVQGQEWFVGEGSNRVLRAEKQKQWCEINRARMQTSAIMLQSSGTSRVNGLLIAALSHQTYKNGCWENDEQYIALRHTVAANSLGKNLFLDMWKNVDWVVGIPKVGVEYGSKNLYSPQQYCREYTDVHTKDYTGKFVDIENLCGQFKSLVSMNLEESKTVRARSDQFIAQHAKGAQ